MSKVNANVFQSLAPERAQVGNWLQHLLSTTRKNTPEKMFLGHGEKQKTRPEFFPLRRKSLQIQCGLAK